MLTIQQIKKQVDEQKKKTQLLLKAKQAVGTSNQEARAERLSLPKPTLTPKVTKPAWSETKAKLTPVQQASLDARNKALVGTTPGAFLYGVMEGVAAPVKGLGTMLGAQETPEEKALAAIAASRKLTASMDASKGMGAPNMITGHSVPVEGAGKLAGSLLPFAAAEQATAKGLGMVLPKLSQPASRVINGAVSGSAVIGLQEYGEGKRGKELAVSVAQGTAMGIGAGIGLGYLGKALRNIKAGQKTADVVADIAKAEPTVKASIERELGIPEGTSWAEFERRLQEKADVEDYYRMMEEQFTPKPVEKKATPIAQATYKTTIGTTRKAEGEPGVLVPKEKLSGSFRLANTELDKAYTDYDKAVEAIQNHFGTNELRQSEIDRILPELGIDINALVKRIEYAETGKTSNLRNLIEAKRITPETARLANVAGVEFPKLNLSETQRRLMPNVEPVVKHPLTPIRSTYPPLTPPTAKSSAQVNKKEWRPWEHPEIHGLDTGAKKAVETQPLTPVAKATTDPNTGLPVYGGAVKPKSVTQPERWASVDINTPKTQSIELKMPKPQEQGPPIPREGGAEIVFDATPEKKSFKRKAQEFRNAVEDDMLDFERLEKRVNKTVGSAEKSIYKTARLYKGAPEKAYAVVKDELAPIVDSAKAAGFTQNELSEYALMVHARDVNARGLESGFSDKEIADTIAKYANTPLEAERKRLVALSDSLIKGLQDDGLLSQAQVQGMREKWPNYMPLFRHFDDEKIDIGHGISQAFTNVSSPIKALKGSRRDVVDPLDSMVKNIFQSTDAGMRNRVGLQLHELAQSNPTINGIPLIRKLEPGETVGRKNVVNIKVNGEKVAYEVEPEVFSVFNNLDKEMSNKLIEWMAKPASVLRAGATLTPEFAVRNPFRDVINAFVVSKSGFNPFTDFAAGLASTVKRGDLYKQWVKEGGAYGNILSMDRSEHQKALKDALKTPVSGKFVNVVNPKAWLKLMQYITDTTESATKVGEFRAALRSGATPQEAAYRARDLMDFARAGHSIRPANRVVAFMNANIQGKSKLLRAIHDNPVRTSARIINSMVLPTMAIAGINSLYASDEQKATIKDAPDWVRNSFWLIPVPGTDMVARFPKPFDISVAANTTERFIEYLADKDPEAFNGFVSSTIKDQSIPVMMTGLLPIVEGMANYSFFRQGPIIPQSESMRNMSNKYQYDSKTSKVAIAAAELFSKLDEDSNLASPRIIDYMIRSSTAGLGSYGLDAIDWAIGKAEGKKSNNPTPTLEQRPVVKAFMLNPRTPGKSVDYLYSVSNTLNNKKGDEKYGAPKLTPTQTTAKKKADSAVEELSDISKQIKKIEADKTMTPDEKQRQILELTKKRNELARSKAKEIKKLIPN